MTMTVSASTSATSPGGPRPPVLSARGVWVGGSRGALVAAGLLGMVSVIGSLGYVLIEGWNPWDALYMTLTTITTVGFREVHPLSRAGQVWTITVLLAGVGTAFYTFSLVAAIVVEGGIREHLHRWRQVRMIDELHDHFIVCGYGRMGSVIVDELRRQHVPYVVIERDPERARALSGADGVVVEADASSEDVLKRLGIDRARGLIAAVGTDAENVYAVLTARVLRPDLYIIARAESEDAERKLLRAGANRVVSPYRIGARELAQTALRPAVVDFFDLAARGNLDLAIEQITIADGSPLAGLSIIQGNVRQRYGVIVVGVQHRGGKMEFNPPGEAVMLAGDQLIVLGRVDGMHDLELAALAAQP
jgi:voltage-gated potassium channel